MLNSCITMQQVELSLCTYLTQYCNIVLSLHYFGKEVFLNDLYLTEDILGDSWCLQLVTCLGLVNTQIKSIQIFITWMRSEEFILKHGSLVFCTKVNLFRHCTERRTYFIIESLLIKENNFVEGSVSINDAPLYTKAVLC